MTVETLTDAGLEQMDTAEIDAFLSNQGFGVLGLGRGPVPYLLPMSYGYGEGALYFTFVVNGESRKEKLAETADEAGFLVYNATTPFQWQSVTLTGAIERLPADRWDDFAGVMDNAWRPDIFDNAETSDARVYQFTVDEQAGYKHTGLPPGLERTESG
jgi:nitroimidazol reductase NimA-like FMN-containing flavoprotein (pyridoxamine 5'-phosphate oxidase superfamily)